MIFKVIGKKRKSEMLLEEIKIEKMSNMKQYQFPKKQIS